jgi:RNA polymerase sigma-70 factor (ECF subfamily)
VSSQEEAIAAVRRREMRGLATIVELHQLKARRTAYLILGDRAAAEDVVAEAFLRVWDRIGTYDVSRPFEPWLYRIVVNLAIDEQRRRARSRRDTVAAEPVAHLDLDRIDARADIGAELRGL